MTKINSVDQKNVLLTFYDEKYNHVLETFTLPDGQQEFTALPMDALEKCAVDKGRHPIVILADDDPVGFFVLHEGEGMRDYYENKQAMLIRALLINHKEQGKGYAKRSMQQLSDFVTTHFPSINELILVVNLRNKSAQNLYKKVGFVDKGIRREGRIGPQMMMHYSLSNNKGSGGF